jgi:MFS transporter, ACS family, tartrate transporter
MSFLGYSFLEVPSNLMLLRVGPRRWIMILMIVLGLFSPATALVESLAVEETARVSAR